MSEAPNPPEPALLTLIARELAQETYTPEQIRERYEISESFYTAILENPFFQRVLASYTEEWHAIKNTPKRVAFAALTALEEKLPILADRMGSRQSGLADAVATAKLFRELAGIAPPAPGQGIQQGPAFAIRIDFGGHKVAVEACETDSRLSPPGEDYLPSPPPGEMASEIQKIQQFDQREITKHPHAADRKISGVPPGGVTPIQQNSKREN